MNFELIVATSLDGVIGKSDGTIPWKQSSDLKRFKQMTDEHVVVYGRKTQESLPFDTGLFPNRSNIILSRDHEKLTHKIGKKILDELIHLNGSTWATCNDILQIESVLNDVYISLEPLHIMKGTVYIVGGGEIYKEALRVLPITKIHHTLVHTEIGELKDNVNFEIPEGWICDAREDHVSIDEKDQHDYSYLTWIPASEYL